MDAAIVARFRPLEEAKSDVELRLRALERAYNRGIGIVVGANALLMLILKFWK